ncbi:trace amine-associated receptor 1-like [Centroberyx gerrardi]
MKKAYNTILLGLFPNSRHVTCLAHLLNLVLEVFPDVFGDVNQLCALVKRVFCQAPQRRLGLRARAVQDLKLLLEKKRAQLKTKAVFIVEHSTEILATLTRLEETSTPSATTIFSQLEDLQMLLEYGRSAEAEDWHPGTREMLSKSVRVLLYIFLGSVSVLTICGNLLVITSILYFKQLHTPTNYLILSLAVSDLLVGAVSLPFSMKYSATKCWYIEDLFCKIRLSVDISLCISSILNLCCISVDRYYAVCQPLRYRTKINVHVAGVMILVNWNVSVLVGLVITILGVNRGKCDITCFTIIFPISLVMSSFFSFYLPAIIMLSIYLKIFLVAQRQALRIQNTNCQSIKSGASVSKKERKATKTLAIVMGIFLICWTPFFLSFTLRPLNNYSTPGPVNETLHWVGLSNSMINPFVYAFFYSWFRAAFRMIISGKIFQGDFANSKLF